MSHTIGFHYWRYGVGGAERVTYALMARLSAAGHRVFLFCDTPEQDGDYPLPTGVERLLVPRDSDERAAFWADRVAGLGIDTVVYGSYVSDRAIEDCRAICATDASLVYMSHSIASYFLDKEDGPRMLDVMETCAELADAVVCLSRADVPFWRLLCGRVFSIPNPVIDWLGATGEPRESPQGSRVVWVARLDPVEKCPDLAIRAFAKLRETVRGATLSMVGGGFPAELERCERLAAELGVADAVDFAGEVPDVTPWLDAADAFMITSPVEGFCLSLAEAMHEGLPCVTFEMPNVELARDCAGVEQVAWRDCDAMAAALARALDPQGYAERSRAVQRRFDEVCDVDVTACWERVLGVVGSHEPADVWGDEDARRFARGALLGYRRFFERKASQLDEAQAARDAALRERDEARAELEAVTGSVSFKVGRALTSLPRALRDIARR